MATPPQGVPIPPPGAGPVPPPLRPGQQPTPEQIAFMQRQLQAEAEKHGMTVPQYVEQLKMQAMRQQQMRMAQQAQAQQQQQQQQGGQPVQGGPPPQQMPQGQPVQPGPPTPQALAVANFLRSQDLKPRTCIFNEKRKDMFRVKRAIRALFSPAYEKARAKNPLLPPVTDRASAENTFKLLPLSLLALRVSKIDPHEGHAHGKKKSVKGLWTVRVEQQQNADDDSHYVWLYEGSQWKTKLYAVGALVAVFAVVLFPLWPLFLRQGVWYLSMGMLGLLGLFFAMAVFRLILFCVTVFVTPPGLWLYPNLFEDVGFFDSFRPVWAWQETEEDKRRVKEAKKAKKVARKQAKIGKQPGAPSAIPAPVAAPTAPAAAPTAAAPATEASTEAQPVNEAPTATGVASPGGETRQRMQASVEEADDE